MQEPGTTPPNLEKSSNTPSWQPPPQQAFPPPGNTPQGYPPQGNAPQGYGPGGQPPQMAPSNNKLAAGLCGILLGGLGIHKFILGYTNEGIIMLCVSLLTCGIGSPIMGVVGIIEGIMYLTKSDQEFMQTYVYNKKPWF